MFDQKSHSSLGKISIQGKNSNEEDRLHLGQVLKRSREALSEVTLKIPDPGRVGTQVAELVAAGSRLKRLIVWEWGFQESRKTFPLSRLISASSRGKASSVGQLQLLWIDQDIKVDSKHLNSLVSFARDRPTEPKEYQELISSFSETVVHLRLEVYKQSSPIKPLFCPNLKVFEGWVMSGVSSFLDAPQLQILVLEDVVQEDLKLLPPSVEDIWLRNRAGKLNNSENWESLLRLCPKLRILKLTKRFVTEILNESFDLTGILEMLQSRNQLAQDKEEIDGIKIVSLQKLILPTSMIKEEQLNRASEVAEEVIDIKDYPKFIEIEY